MRRTEGPTLRYSIFGHRLYPSDVFYRFLLGLPADTRNDLEIKRLGVLTEQLRPYQEKLMLRVSEANKTTNDDFELEPFYSQPRPIPEEIKTHATDIAQNALGRDTGVIINERQFHNEVVEHVLWLLYQLRDELPTERKEAIGAYCEQTGLTGTAGEESTDSTDGNDSDDSYGVVPSFDSGRSNIDIPDVSKL